MIYVQYMNRGSEFIYWVAFWAVYPAIALVVGAFLLLRRLGWDSQTQSAKRLARRRLIEELTRTRRAFEDEAVVEPFDRSQGR